jgi:alginate O-acetyltransferase complex protein AlgI
LLFNSPEFVVFLTLVLGVHFGVLSPARHRARKLFLLAASYAFYASYNPPFVVLLFISTIVDFFMAKAMAASVVPWRRRAALVVSLLTNLGLLGFFKYGEFLAQNFTVAAASMGIDLPAPQFSIFLPVGISFYTFQTLSYSIDVYRGQLEPSDDFFDFALYVSFFPQLVAGPIVRAGDFLPQLKARLEPKTSQLEYGILRICAGLTKKVVFADTLGAYVDIVYASPGSFEGVNVLLAFYAYAYQIYFDFSAYSDIAIGLGSLFGLKIPENFDRPYLATSPRDFWRRWHITLSTWLRDYLYISLGGNRGTRLSTTINLFVTMLLGGLWHGAAWNFVIWGAYHGLLLTAQRLLEPLMPSSLQDRGVVLKRIVTFHLVCVGWVFFRAPTTAVALELLSSVASLDWIGWRVAHQACLILAASIGIHVALEPERWRARFVALRPELQGVTYAVAMGAVVLFSSAAARFIYFQF